MVLFFYFWSLGKTGSVPLSAATNTIHVIAIRQQLSTRRDSPDGSRPSTNEIPPIGPDNPSSKIA